MKIWPILLVTALLVACSDDDSDFAVRPSDGTSSSVKEIATNSSSSRNDKSSSSEYKRVPCNVAKDENCMKDERDDQTYRTVKIGDQLWMAENLNYVYLQSTEDLDSISFCYNDSAEYCEKYGRLYTWAAAMDSVGVWSTDAKGCGNNPSCFPSGTIRGICPEGWHLPSKDEWDTLLTVVGDSSVAGTRLKSTSWMDEIVGENGSGDSGFMGLPAGNRNLYGKFIDEGDNAYFWSSSEFNSHDGIGMDLLHDNNGRLSNSGKPYGYSVRCIKNSLE